MFSQDGLNLHKRTQILYGVENAVGKGVKFMENVKGRMDITFDHHAPSIVVKIPEYYNGYKDILKRGGKIRCITEVTLDNIEYCKELLNLVTELRHLDGLKGGIAINELEYMATTLLQEEQPLTEVIHSNVDEVVAQGQFIFDTFWKNSVPALKKIREIEEKIIPQVIESISDPKILQSKVFELLKSANQEILVIFSTANAFHRQKREGAMDILKQVEQAKPKVKIKILTPKDDSIEDICKELAHNPNFNYKFMEPIIRVSILVVDRKFSIVAELRDDTKKTSAESIGLATYSNSAPTVLTYAVIFEALWNQSELYDKLKLQDRLQKEFINIAAHELRTPVQSLLGFSDILLNTKGNIEYNKNYIVTINQSTKRLARLIDKVLDFTQLENEVLILKKESFNLEHLAMEIVKEYNNNAHLLNKSHLEIQYSTGKDNNNKIDNHHKYEDFGMIHADKIRIIQVIMNLLDNAIEFTKSGKITLIIKENTATNQIILSISDSGCGIDQEMLPKLFTKFVKKSRKGTGLGLYISKKIIEAHGGKIWAENYYKDNKIAGSIFSFSLSSEI